MHPLAAPGTLWVLSSDGKYLVRPQADETSHKKQVSCGRQGKRAFFTFRVSQRISPLRRRPGGFPIAPWTPSGAHPFVSGRNLPQETDSLWKARERPSLLFPVLQKVSPLRRRPKGFPIALWKPSGPSCGNGKAREKNFLWKARERPSLLFPVLQRVSPLRRRPKGFPIALWKPSALSTAIFPAKNDCIIKE